MCMEQQDTQRQDSIHEQPQISQTQQILEQNQQVLERARITIQQLEQTQQIQQTQNSLSQTLMAQHMMQQPAAPTFGIAVARSWRSVGPA